MKLKLIVKLLSDAYKKEIEEKLWQRWLVDYGSRMDAEHFTSFEEYKKELMKPKVNNKINIKKILEDAEQIKALDQKGGN